MTGRLSNRLNAVLETFLPEQRLFLRSDVETRFIRLRPLTQAVALGGTSLILAWTIIATAVLLMDSIGFGSARDQSRREQSLYATRLNTLSIERDQRAEEAANAQERFNVALEQISRMQSALLASEDRRKELDTGIEVIQKTLRTAVLERDDARDAASSARADLVAQTGTSRTPASVASDTEDTLDFLTKALSSTATERDAIMLVASETQKEADAAYLATRLLEERNDQIFSQLEEAVTVSMEPLDAMFRAAGLQPDDVLAAVRRGYSGQGGPLTPLSFSTKGSAPDPGATRANGILESLDRMNMYRIAAEKTPFALPVKSAFRYTSGFGYRDDPKGAGTRMHTGTDFAASYGTPIYATADGTVTFAGWESGYGRLVKIQHEFGIETWYAHQAQIRVEVGQRVSRGERIGDMGNSGRSTGTHLHYEVRVGGNPVNAMTYIKAANNVF